MQGGRVEKKIDSVRKNQFGDQFIGGDKPARYSLEAFFQSVKVILFTIAKTYWRGALAFHF